MNNFMIFVAPFLVLIAAIGVTFWFAPKDGAIQKKDK